MENIKINTHGLLCACGACGKTFNSNKEIEHQDPFKAVDLSIGSVNYHHAVSTLQMGYSWSNMTGQAAQVTYSFAYDSWGYGSENHTSMASGYSRVNETQKNAINQALANWESVANIDLVEANNGDDTNIVFRQADIGDGIAGWAVPFNYQDSNQFARADVVFDSNYTNNAYVGQHSFSVMLHEIGHALGLDHPDSYNGNTGAGGANAYDNLAATVMSYYSTNVMPTTLMVLDIATIQSLYGVNHNYNSGNDTYAYNGAKNNTVSNYFDGQTIWDGNGVDTIDSTQFQGNADLDLREGLNHKSLIGNDFVWIANGANIENAVSGNGNDIVHGNRHDNILNSGNGNDTLTGGNGNDQLIGGTGHDVFAISNGHDVVRDFELGIDKIGLNSKTSAENALNNTSYNNGNAFIDLGADSFTLLGVGDDVLSFDDFIA